MNDNLDDNFNITRHKSNTFSVNLVSEKNNNSLKKSSLHRSTNTNFDDKKNNLDKSNETNSKDKIIDSGGEISSIADKTKEIELLLSDPDLMDNVEDKLIFNDDSRTTLQKLIAKMGKGSLRRIILNLSIINICISSLNLSQKMIYASIYIYPIVIIFIGIISYLTLDTISKTGIKYKKKSYEGIIKEILFKQLIPVYIFCVILNYFGNIILEEIILYQLLVDVVTKFFEKKEELFSTKKSKYIISYGIAIFILLPLFQIINYDKFGKITIIKIIILISILIILLTNYILLFIYNYNINDIKEKFSIKNNSNETIFTNTDIFSSISVLFYTFSYHDQFFPSIEKLCIPSAKRINKIIKRTIIIDVIISLLLSVVGFFSLKFDMIKDLIIFRNVEVEKDYILNDYLMTIGRIFYFIFLLFKLFKDYQILRNNILANICCYNIKKLGRIVNLLTSFFILSIATFVAVHFQYISEFISLIGASSSVYISFIIPLIIFINESDYSILNWKKLLSIFLIIIFSFCSICSIFFTITKILDNI